MTFVRRDPSIPCVRVHIRNTTYTIPLLGVHSPSVEMTMTAQNIRANPSAT